MNASYVSASRSIRLPVRSTPPKSCSTCVKQKSRVW